MTTLALVVAAVLAAPGAASPTAAPPADPAPATASAEVRARTRALLGAIDRPVSPEAFRRLGPEAEVALAEIALSDPYPAFRARALGALAALGAPRAEELHRRVATDLAAPRTARRAAVRGLARLVSPERAAAELRPLLEQDADPGVRAAAAEALARAAPSAGCGAVRRQAAREAARPDGSRGAALGRALAVCDRHRDAGGARRERGR